MCLKKLLLMTACEEKNAMVSQLFFFLIHSVYGLPDLTIMSRRSVLCFFGGGVLQSKLISEGLLSVCLLLTDLID